MVPFCGRMRSRGHADPFPFITYRSFDTTLIEMRPRVAIRLFQLVILRCQIVGRSCCGLAHPNINLGAMLHTSHGCGNAQLMAVLFRSYVPCITISLSTFPLGTLGIWKYLETSTRPHSTGMESMIISAVLSTTHIPQNRQALTTGPTFANRAIYP